MSNPESLTAQAEAISSWAEQKTAPAESPSYTRLTDADRITILTLRDKGLSYLAIAQRVNRSLDTIHNVITTYAPTLDMAKRKLAAGAVRMAENVVENGQPRDHVKALEGLGVLQPTDNAGVIVYVNGVKLHGTGNSQAIEGEVLSPLPMLTPGEGEPNP